MAREYSEKMKRGFKEISDLKKDIAASQEKYETS